jgi:RNA polymerase sigma-70 factor, ECF subfamily
MVVLQMPAGSSPEFMEADERALSPSARDLDAFARLYDKYNVRIQRYIRARVADEIVAEDLSAQVFTRALASISDFRGEGTYKAWIFRIARNALADWYASHAREVPVDEVPDDGAAEESPLTIALIGEERDLVRRKVEELSDAQREVVRLHYWRGLSIDEIARSTRRSSVAVRQLLHRARRHLKRTLSRKDVAILLSATGASAAAFAARTYRRNRKGDR